MLQPIPSNTNGFDARLVDERFAELLIPAQESVAVEGLLFHVDVDVDDAMGFEAETGCIEAGEAGGEQARADDEKQSE